MTVFDKGLVTVLACEALFVALSVPLVLRKVPPNVVYGYRTRATLADEALWYEANAYFGARLLAASLLSGLGFAAIRFLVDLSPQTFVPLSVVALGLPVLVAGVATSGYISGRSARGE